MAVRFDAETDQYSVTTGQLPAGGNTYTVTWWGKIVVDRNAYSAFWSVDNAGASYCTLEAGSDGTTLAWYSNMGGVALDGGVSLAVGTWYRLAASCDPAGDVSKLYIGQESHGGMTVATGTTQGEGGAAATSLRIGAAGFSGEWLNGSIGNFKQFNSVLTQAEIETELASYTVTKTANIVRQYKFTVAETTDYSGNGHTLTAGGTSTTTDTDEPPMAPPPVHYKSQALGMRFRIG